MRVKTGSRSGGRADWRRGFAALPWRMPNFVLLDTSQPDITQLLVAMLQARQAVARRSWSHPQQAAGEDWWADVLADPRARKRDRRLNMAIKQSLYRLADEPRTTILVACSKCDWKAAYHRNELIASRGAAYPMPSLLNELAKPGCARLGNQWDHCGVYYVEPIGTVDARIAHAPCPPIFGQAIRW